MWRDVWRIMWPVAVAVLVAATCLGWMTEVMCGG